MWVTLALGLVLLLACNCEHNLVPCFMQVLQELVGDKSLERFRVEYEKLFRTLKKSHGEDKSDTLHVTSIQAYKHTHTHPCVPCCMNACVCMGADMCPMSPSKSALSPFPFKTFVLHDGTTGSCI